MTFLNKLSLTTLAAALVAAPALQADVIFEDGFDDATGSFGTGLNPVDGEAYDFFGAGPNFFIQVEEATSFEGFGPTATTPPNFASINADAGNVAGFFISTGDAAAAGTYTLSFDQLPAVFGPNTYTGTITGELYASDDAGFFTGAPFLTVTSTGPARGSLDSATGTAILTEALPGNVFVRIRTEGDFTDADNFQQGQVDTISVDFAPIPEPASALLLGAGAALMGLRRRG